MKKSKLGPGPRPPIDVPTNGWDVIEKMTVALYLRVSTDRQANEGDSLEEQENELKKYCDYRGFSVHKVFIERGKSGGNTNRPEYQALLKDIQANKIDAVVVKKLDRLSRSLLDFEALMVMMQQHNVDFISLREQFDTTTAMGKAMLRVALVFAQLEREQTAERISDVMQYRASQGLYNGGIRPYGYTSINTELVPYPKEKQVVEVMINQFLTLKSTSLVAKFLNDAGFRNRQGNLWDKRQIQKTLQNPIYTGKVKWYDQIFQGIHAPLISETQFQEIQKLFQYRSSSQDPSKTEALLKRLIHCGHCGNPMTPSFGINRFKKKYCYYRCTSTQNSEKANLKKCIYKYVPFSVADEGVLASLLDLSDTVGFASLENLLFKHNDGLAQIQHRLKAEKQLLDTQLDALKAKKDRYLDSLIDRNFLSSERQSIQSRIEELEMEEKQIKSKGFKLDLEINQKESEKINAMALKQSFVIFKSEHETYTSKQLKDAIFNLIDRIIYHPDRLAICLKGLPWEMEFELNRKSHNMG